MLVTVERGDGFAVHDVRTDIAVNKVEAQWASSLTVIKELQRLNFCTSIG